MFVEQFVAGERGAAFQRVIALDALAQCVDGRDRCAIQIGTSQLDLSQRTPPAFLISAQCSQIIFQRMIVRRYGVGRRRIEQPTLGFDQPSAQTFAQLLRGGIGERGNQNLFHAQLAFQQKTQVDHADVPGLAGAGAGLDQDAAVQRHALPVERGRRCRIDGARADHASAPLTSTDSLACGFNSSVCMGSSTSQTSFVASTKAR